MDIFIMFKRIKTEYSGRDSKIGNDFDDSKNPEEFIYRIHKCEDGKDCEHPAVFHYFQSGRMNKGNSLSDLLINKFK